MSTVPHGNSSRQRLVIFGCGYVGAAVAEQALAAGIAVTALTRNAATAAALRAGGIDTTIADIASDAWHESIGTAPAFVLNCVSSGGGGADGYRRSYVAGMQSILRWARQAGKVGTFVYTSSTSVYPQGEGRVVDEGAPTGAVDEQGAALVDAERSLMESTDPCRRWFVLRLAGIYGPGRHYLLEQVRSGVVAGRGEHHLNLAHRDDIVAAILACFGADPRIGSEILNVADDAPARKDDVVDWLASRLRVTPPTFTGVPAGRRRAVTPDRIITNGKLKSLLGWKPRFPSFRDGYEAILAQAT